MRIGLLYLGKARPVDRGWYVHDKWMARWGRALYLGRFLAKRSDGAKFKFTRATVVMALVEASP